MTTADAAPDCPAQERARRLKTTRQAMDASGLDALVLASPENIYYLAGLNHYGYFATTLLLVGRDGPPLLVARAMELPTLRVQVPECEHVTYSDDEDPAEVAVRALRALTPRGARIGVEEDAMNLPVRVWRALAAGLPDTEWIDASDLLAAQRAVKTASEIAHVRQAARLSDRALQAGIDAVREGINERDVAAAIYRELITAGSDVPAYPPFIRASEDIPQEHVTWRHDRLLRRGDRVFFELGASVARYHAPMSRIVYVAHKPDGADAAAEIVSAGLQAVLARIQPGVLAGDVYAAWHRAVSDRLGHDNYHRHHCGYLTGLGFPPSWVGGSAVAGLRRDSELVIEEGMVLHVMSWLLGQPLPDYGVSDTAVVTSDGCELLTTTAREPHVTAS